MGKMTVMYRREEAETTTQMTGDGVRLTIPQAPFYRYGSVPRVGVWATRVKGMPQKQLDWVVASAGV